MTVRILNGDCRAVLATLPSASVHCIVTSPPYYGLRDYGTDGQIGLEQAPDAYVSELVAVFREARRVLRDDGTLWLNLGDSYNNFRSQMGPGQALHGRERLNGKPAPNSRGRGIAGLKEKDLIGIPWRVAFALQADGWWLRQDIIWSKPNPMPESVTDRCTKAHEYLFMLSKSARYWYDAEAISEPASKGAAGSAFNAGKTAIHQLGRSGTAERKEAEARNRRSVWSIATQPYGDAHFATMPPALAELCIKAGTSEKGCCTRCGSGRARITDGASYYAGDDGSRDRKTNQVGNGHGGHGRGPKNDLGASIAKTVGWQSSCSCPAHEPIPATVLDPFGGAGTTGLVADRLGRNAVLIELNPDYATMARHRIEGDGGMFSSVLEAAE